MPFRRRIPSSFEFGLHGRSRSLVTAVGRQGEFAGDCIRDDRQPAQTGRWVHSIDRIEAAACGVQ